MTVTGLNMSIVARAGESFFTEQKVPIFFVALAVFILIGLLVGNFEKIRKIFFIGLMLALLYPTIDIHFFADPAYLGVTRGLYLTLADLILVSLFCGTIVGASKRKLIIFPRCSAVFIIWILACALSLINAKPYAIPGFVNPGYAYGLFELFNMVKGLVLMWVIINFVRSEKEIKFMINAFIAMLILETSYVLYAHFILKAGLTRAAGSVGHPNILAMLMGLFIPLMLVIALAAKRSSLSSLLYVFALLCAFGMMIKTSSRAGIGTMCLVGAITAFFVLRMGRRLNWSRIVVIGVVFLIGSAIIVNRYWDRMFLRFGQVAGEATASSEARWKLTEAGWDIAKKNIVIGNGLNGFVYEVFSDPKYIGSRAVEHNLYLLMLAESGLLGTGAMLLLFIRFLWIGWRRLYRQNFSPALKALSIGMFCGMLHVMIQSYFEFIFRFITISYFFWIMGGLIVSASYIVDRKKQMVTMLRRKAMIERIKKKKADAAKRQLAAQAAK